MHRVFLGSLLLLFSCSEPVCGCLARLPGVTLQGTLVSASGVPQAGWSVRATIAVGTCLTYHDSHQETVSNAEGLVRLELMTMSTDSSCVELWARDTTAGSEEERLPATYRVVGREWPYRTVVVPMVRAP